jgi:hypothetical protein
MRSIAEKKSCQEQGNRSRRKNLRDDIFLRHGVQQEEAVCAQEIRSLRVEKNSSD